MKIENRFNNTRSIIQKLIDESRTPSLSVGVAHNGEILWKEGFGFADREKKIPATEQSIYNLASISKVFTATGIMILSERGQLDLDKSIQHYLPDLQITYHHGSPEELTIRTLANHSSGLPMHFSYHYSDEETKPYSIPEAVQRYGNIVAPPMERSHYSNLGYGILGYLIEETTGMTYGEFMENEVFQPLGMENSHVINKQTRRENNVTFYGPDGMAEFDEKGTQKFVQYGTSFDKIPYSETDTPGSGAVSCSVHDLLKFGMFHIDGGPILSNEELVKMRKPTSAPTIINAPPSAFIDENTKYGIGWRISDLNGYDIAWHDGGKSGASTKLVLIPSESLVVIALCNRFQPLVTDQVVVSIISELLPRGPIPDKTPTFLPNDSPLAGEWNGAIHTPDGKVALTLWVNENEEAYSKLDHEVKHPFYISRASDNYFWGVLKGDLSTEDTKRYPHDVSLDLKRRGDVLDGYAVAMCLKTPSNRMGYALSFWTELRKVDSNI